MFFNNKNQKENKQSSSLIDIKIHEIKLHGYEGGGSGIYFKISNLSSELVELVIDKCYVVNKGSMINGEVWNNVGFLGTTSQKLDLNMAAISQVFFRWDTIQEFNIDDEVILSVLDVINLDEYKFTYKVKALEESERGQTISLTNFMNIAHVEQKKFSIIDKCYLLPEKVLNKYLKSKIERFEGLEENLFINISNISFKSEVLKSLGKINLTVFIEIILVGDIQSDKICIVPEVTLYNEENDIIGNGYYKWCYLSKTTPIETSCVNIQLKEEFPAKIRVLARKG